MKLRICIIHVIFALTSRSTNSMDKAHQQFARPAKMEYAKFRMIEQWLMQVPQVQQQNSLKVASQQFFSFQITSPSPTVIDRTEQLNYSQKTSYVQSSQETPSGLNCPVQACKKKFTQMQALKAHAYKAHNVHICPCMQ